MKKKFNVLNLDCAHCASKIEDAINKIATVEKANVSFLTQKIIIEAEEENFEAIMKEVVVIAKKIEPDCEVVIK